MSARVEQIIEILEELRTHYRVNPGIIKEARKDAVEEVAYRRGVDPKTVADKYIRWLNPPVEKTGDFDQLVSDWLRLVRPSFRIFLRATAEATMIERELLSSLPPPKRRSRKRHRILMSRPTPLELDKRFTGSYEIPLAPGQSRPPTNIGVRSATTD